MSTLPSARIGRGARLSPEQRRQQIIEVTLDLLGDPEFTELTFDDVARAAGISRNLVYHYFPGRDALILAATSYESDNLREKLMAVKEAPGQARITTVLESYLDYVAEHAQGYRAVHRHAVRSAPTFERLESDHDNYAAWLLSWFGEATPMARLAVRAWVSSLVSTCTTWSADPDQVSRDELIAYFTNTFTLAADPAAR